MRIPCGPMTLADLPEVAVVKVHCFPSQSLAHAADDIVLSPVFERVDAPEKIAASFSSCGFVETAVAVRAEAYVVDCAGQTQGWVEG